jgi:DNA-binding CsgD family transcriptional regulator
LYSNREIAVRLSASVKTVEALKPIPMRKLGIGNRVGIVCFAIL